MAKEDYEKNPKVCGCGNLIPYEKRENDSCCQSCAAIKRNTGVRRHGKPPRICEGCGIETRNPKFCNNACQKEHEWKEIKKSIDDTGICPKYNRMIRRYLIEKWGHHCWICKGVEWMGKPIPIEVDHINGNPNDHAVENVRMVCGNCGMQLPTYKGKNRGNGRWARRDRYAQGKSF